MTDVLRRSVGASSVGNVIELAPIPAAATDQPALSVAVPVYNEESTVLAVIDALLATPFDFGVEIIVVNDGSTDGTAAALSTVDSRRVIIKHHDRNLGKGAAIRTAAGIARGRHLVPFDADLEYDTADLSRLMAPILGGRAEVVYGSRVFGNNTVYQSYRYAVGNKVMTFAANVLFDAHISDLHTCLKVVPVSIFRRLPLTHVGYGLDTELTALLLREGVRPFEVPVSYYSRTHRAGKKITWRDAVECFWVLGSVRLRRSSDSPTPSVLGPSRFTLALGEVDRGGRTASTAASASTPAAG